MFVAIIHCLHAKGQPDFEEGMGIWPSYQEESIGYSKLV